MTISIWSPQIVDRIHMAMTIVSKEYYGVLIGQIFAMKDVQCDLVPKGKISVFEGKSFTRLDYYPRKKRKIAEIQMGSTKSGKMYFRLALYPSKFNADDFQIFKEHIELFFQISYLQLFLQSKVSYLELAADSFSYSIESFIPFRSISNYSYRWKNTTGDLGSIYIGSVISKKRFCIYDKRKKLAKDKHICTHPIRTRIEVRLRHIGCSPSQIAEKLENPFSVLEAADTVKARGVSMDAHWQGFLDRCIEDGSASALAQCSKTVRKKYMTMLRASAVSWWKPDYLYKHLPEALQVIAP